MAETLRALGQIEAAMAAAHELAAGTTQGVQCLRLSGRFEAQALRRALQALHARHQALRCVLRPDGDGWAFAEAAPFEAVPVHIGTLVPVRWQDTVAQEQNGAPVDAARALWGVSLYSDVSGADHLLVLRYHHAIVDGDSVNPLVEELLGLCDAFMRGETPAAKPPVALLPAVDGFLKPADTAAAAAAAAAPEALPSVAQARPVPLAERRTGQHRVVLEPEVLQRLDARCRADKLERNAMLGAALAVAARDTGFWGDRVDFKTAVSLRGCLPAEVGPREALGCYLSVAGTVIDATQPLAAAARAYHRALFDAVMRQALRLRPVAPSALRAGMRAVVDADRFAGFGMTNLGALPLPTQWSAFEVTDYLPLARRLAGQHAFVLHVVEFRGRLLATWVFTEPLMDRAVVGRIADRFTTLLTTESPT